MLQQSLMKSCVFSSSLVKLQQRTEQRSQLAVHSAPFSQRKSLLSHISHHCATQTQGVECIQQLHGEMISKTAPECAGLKCKCHCCRIHLFRFLNASQTSKVWFCEWYYNYCNVSYMELCDWNSCRETNETISTRPRTTLSIRTSPDECTPAINTTLCFLEL